MQNKEGRKVLLQISKPKLVETEEGRQVRCFLVSDEEEPEVE